MDRTQRLLAGILAVQIVLLAIIHNPFVSKRAAADQPMFPGLSSILPEKVEIDGPQGASVTFEREGGAWVLGEPKGYPVTVGKVEKAIQDLEHLTARRQVVSGSRHHAALKVAANDFERRVRIWEKPTGNPRAELYLGSSPSYGVSHVRAGGNDRVFEASGLSAYDIPADPGQWIDRSLSTIVAQDVSRAEITNRKGSFTLEKQGGVWTVVSPSSRSNVALDQEKVNELVRTLGGLSLEEPAGLVDAKAQGLADPEATVVLAKAPAADTAAARSAPALTSTAPAAPVTIQIGGPVAGKDQRYATRTGLGFAVTVGKYGSDRALGATLSDLVKQPAKPASPAAGKPASPAGKKP